MLSHGHFNVRGRSRWDAIGSGPRLDMHFIPWTIRAVRFQVRCRIKWPRYIVSGIPEWKSKATSRNRFSPRRVVVIITVFSFAILVSIVRKLLFSLYFMYFILREKYIATLNILLDKVLCGWTKNNECIRIDYRINAILVFLLDYLLKIVRRTKCDGHKSRGCNIAQHCSKIDVRENNARATFAEALHPGHTLKLTVWN